MKFRELLLDHSVKAARLARLKMPDEYVELPPVADGRRGPWCTLVAFDFDTKAIARTPLLSAMLDGNESDWEPYTPPDQVGEGR